MLKIDKILDFFFRGINGVLSNFLNFINLQDIKTLNKSTGSFFMIPANFPNTNQNIAPFQEQEKRRELTRLISVLSNTQRQYEQQKTEKNLHNLIDSLVSIDITLLDFINYYNLNPAQYTTLKYPLIDLYSIKLFEHKNIEEFQKNVCVCYNIITDHFQKLEKYNNVIFDAFSRKVAE